MCGIAGILTNQPRSPESLANTITAIIAGHVEALSVGDTIQLNTLHTAGANANVSNAFLTIQRLKQ